MVTYTLHAVNVVVNGIFLLFTAYCHYYYIPDYNTHTPLHIWPFTPLLLLSLLYCHHLVITTVVISYAIT